MAKKKATLDQKLDPGMQSWETQVSQSVRASPKAPEPEPDDPGDKLQRKTFLVTPVLINRINRLSKQQSVGQNELVRYLLEWSLDQVESGAHKIPLKPRYTIER
jgi:hypothetical protein